MSPCFGLGKTEAASPGPQTRFEEIGAQGALCTTTFPPSRLLARFVGSPPYSELHRGATQLLQLCILGFGLLEDRDVRVRIFPERKEVLIGRSCLGVITRQRVSPAQLQVRQCAYGITDHESSV